jgi:Na+/H+ antiporter NhaA
MINTLYNIFLLLLGIYILFVGYTIRNDIVGGELNVEKNKLLITQMVLGGILVFISLYKLYNS